MAKGGSFEREISKFLTKWLTGKEKPYKYWRQDASGGLATIHEENVHLTGDIKPLARDSEFFTDVFSIECKTGYPKTSFWQHFKSTKFALEQFWVQCVEDTPENKHPMLIYRKLRRKSIVGINSIIKDSLYFLIKGLNSITVTWEKDIKCERCGKIHPLEQLFLYDMEDFFELVKPEYIEEIIIPDFPKRIDYGNFELDSRGIR
jgi:hypothetical protein